MSQSPSSSRKPYLVGITGGSASGKTYFLRALMSHFAPEDICLVSQDNYYKEIAAQPLDHKGIENFDLPESLDSELYTEHIKHLLSGKDVTIKEYNFNKKDVPDTFITYKPAPVIIVEGIFVYHYPEVARMLDLKLYIDATETVKIKRRIARDNQERGYDLDDVLYRYEYHVMPTYKRYIEPYKDMADIVVPNNHNFDRALEVIVDHLKAKITWG